ncbi:TrmH family RNA methyltransferase [Phenylobacterium sp.]|uniref:TrmH family RNA methyltransferase n=1 Tax=Phenylobacterium sp. TaxID=1871053 RepID=UPI0039830AEA
MTRAVAIDDPSDPRIEAYLQVRERDVVGRDGGFIAEGQVVLEKAVRASRHPLVSVLVAQKRVAALSGLLDALPAQVSVYAAGQAVMDAIVGFPIHRGVLAAGRRAEPAAARLLAGLPERALVVALCGIANHDNMGGVFRNAAAFGADAVLLDADCCDPLYRKAIRVSVGAALTTPFARLPAGADMAATLIEAGLDCVALAPGGETELHALRPAPRTAVLFGAEGPGLPPALLARARTVRIQMAGGFDSLNVATTSGIVLHRIAAHRAKSPI